MSSYENLGELRERMMGLSRSFVARTTGLDEERLAALEDGDPPTMAELEHLERLYGIDSDVLAEEPIEVPASDAVSALALLDEFREVSPRTKTQLLRAARAARDVVELRAMVDGPDGQEWVADDTSITPPTIKAIPLERRTDVARLASLAYSRGRIGRDRYARLLGVTPAEDLEAMLDQFSLAPPDGRAAR